MNEQKISLFAGDMRPQHEIDQETAEHGRPRDIMYWPYYDKEDFLANRFNLQSVELHVEGQ